MSASRAFCVWAVLLPIVAGTVRPAEGLAVRAPGVLGQWDVEGSQCVIVTGERDCWDVEDRFTFLKRKHRFQTIDAKRGRWRRESDRVKMRCANREAKRLLNEDYEGTGITVTRVKYWKFTARVTRRKLKNIRLRAKYFITYYGEQYTVRETGHYVGTRSSGGGRADEGCPPTVLSGAGSRCAAMCKLPGAGSMSRPPSPSP